MEQLTFDSDHDHFHLIPFVRHPVVRDSSSEFVESYSERTIGCNHCTVMWTLAAGHWQVVAVALFVPLETVLQIVGNLDSMPTRIVVVAAAEVDSSDSTSSTAAAVDHHVRASDQGTFVHLMLTLTWTLMALMRLNIHGSRLQIVADSVEPVAAVASGMCTGLVVVVSLT